LISAIIFENISHKSLNNSAAVPSKKLTIVSVDLAAKYWI